MRFKDSLYYRIILIQYVYYLIPLSSQTTIIEFWFNCDLVLNRQHGINSKLLVAISVLCAFVFYYKMRDLLATFSRWLYPTSFWAAWLQSVARSSVWRPFFLLLCTPLFYYKWVFYCWFIWMYDKSKTTSKNNWLMMINVKSFNLVLISL